MTSSIPQGSFGLSKGHFKYITETYRNLALLGLSKERIEPKSIMSEKSKHHHRSESGGGGGGRGRSSGESKSSSKVSEKRSDASAVKKIKEERKEKVNSMPGLIGYT